MGRVHIDSHDLQGVIRQALEKQKLLPVVEVSKPKFGIPRQWLDFLRLRRGLIDVSVLHDGLTLSLPTRLM